MDDTAQQPAAPATVIPAGAPAPAPARARPRLWLRLLAAMLGALVVLTLAMASTIALMDWNRFKPWVNEKVSTATGREFAINGDLQLHWTWPQPLDDGWRHWVPGVTVTAADLRLGQPSGWQVSQAPDKGSSELPALPAVPRVLNAGRLPGSAKAIPQAADDADAIDEAPEQLPERSPSTMITAARATASLRLWPLLARHVQLDQVVLEAPDIVLARKQDGENNWTFPSPESSRPPWTVTLGQLRIRHGVLGWADGVKNMAVRARVDTLRKPVDENHPYGLRFGLSGHMGKAQIQAQGLTGPVLDLRQDRLRFPLRVSARAGSIQAQAEGFLDNPKTLDGLDFQVRLRGNSMADLFPLTGLLLPATPAFETSGHLIGSLQPGKAVWDYQKFQGKVGQSDLRGDLHYSSGQPRPKLSGKLSSQQLRLADLGPVIGAAPSGMDGRDGSSGSKSRATNGKVLPQARFETANWDAMDLDLRYESGHILRPETLPLQNLSLRAVLDNGKLTLSPLKFGIAQGTLGLDATVDSHAKPVRAQIKGQVSALRLSALFPKVEAMQKSLGRLDGAVSLQGRGESVAQWLGSSDGAVRLYVREGTFSRQMLDMAGLNVGSIIVAKLFGTDKEVQLRCAVADFNVQNGLAKPRMAKLATTEAIVQATGQINLAKETLDLRIAPESLKWKFFSLRTPLYVRGSFGQPDVGLEAGPLLARAGAAVAAMVAAPVALALVPLTVPAAEDDVNCRELLTQVHAK